MPFQRWRALVEARVAEYPAFEPEPIENVFRCGLN
jgi:phage terminase large subunit-like protein